MIFFSLAASFGLLDHHFFHPLILNKRKKSPGVSTAGRFSISRTKFLDALDHLVAWKRRCGSLVDFEIHLWPKIAFVFKIAVLVSPTSRSFFPSGMVIDYDAAAV